MGRYRDYTEAKEESEYNRRRVRSTLSDEEIIMEILEEKEYQKREEEKRRKEELNQLTNCVYCGKSIVGSGYKVCDDCNKKLDVERMNCIKDYGIY